MTPEGYDRPAPPWEPVVVPQQPKGPRDTSGPSTESRCVKTAAARAAEQTAPTKAVTPTVSVRRQIPEACASALKEALETVQRCQ